MGIVGGLLVWALVGIVVLIPVVLFLFSLSSRKSYRCPQCGEQITTEYLSAKHCGMCGAPLEQREV